MGRLDGKCRFVPLRYGLDVTSMPPLLRTLHSPSLENYSEDLRSLVGFFLGISEKPPLGNDPSLPAVREQGMGVSAAARQLVQMMMAQTRYALPMDPQLSAATVRSELSLTDNEIVDAVFELEGRGLVRKHVTSSAGRLGFSRLVPEAELFVEFDAFYTDWNPKEDGVRVAAELMSQNEESCRLAILAERLEWTPRRMNPAVTYLLERNLVRGCDGLGSGPWCTISIRRTDATRRFLQSRS